MIIKKLFEEKEKNLIGIQVNGCHEFITADTMNQVWDNDFSVHYQDITSLYRLPTRSAW